MNATVSIKTANALRAHRNANGDGKKLLENLIGKEVFENQDVRDLIHSFEDAQALTGAPDVPAFLDVAKDRRERHKALYMMEVIIAAYNQGWEPDWNNSNEQKWIAWFKMSPSGFAFSCALYDYSRANAGSGSRLYHKSAANCSDCATKFLDVWKKIQLG